MIILGIDPSLNSCGYGLIQVKNQSISLIECGSISHAKDTLTHDKIIAIYRIIKQLSHKYKPSIFSIEDTFVNSNPQTSLKLGMVRGACICAVEDIEGIKIFQYEPKIVKKTLTGKGGADKIQVSYMVKIMLPAFNAKNDDESDALALAITAYLNNSKLFDK